MLNVLTFEGSLVVKEMQGLYGWNSPPMEDPYHIKIDLMDDRLAFLAQQELKAKRIALKHLVGYLPFSLTLFYVSGLLPQGTFIKIGSIFFAALFFNRGIEAFQFYKRFIHLR